MQIDSNINQSLCKSQSSLFEKPAVETDLLF